MTLQKFLQISTKKLTKAGIATARLDCLVLLEDATGKDRSHILAHPDFAFQGGALKTLEAWVERRARHEPLAYIRGKSEFYGREFIVNKHTLQPRPESETIITLLKELIHGSQKPHSVEGPPTAEEQNVNWAVIDVGTGSGCLAVTAKLELPGLEVHATDVSSRCISTAKKNSIRLDAEVHFYQGDLIRHIPTITFHIPTILICNLPYVPDSRTINESAMFEPKVAIFGGDDGLDHYRKLFTQINGLVSKPKYILTESLPPQHKELNKIALNHGYKLSKTDDFIQLFSSSEQPLG